jgi:hypothetical protein
MHRPILISRAIAAAANRMRANAQTFTRPKRRMRRQVGVE